MIICEKARAINAGLVKYKQPTSDNGDFVPVRGGFTILKRDLGFIA